MNQEKLEKLEKQKKLTRHEREAPHAHLIQALSAVIFIIIIILDGEFLQWSTQLNNIVPFLVRCILFVLFLSIAFFLMHLSNKALFHNNKPSDNLITDGILKRVRNPLYFGIMCIYIAFLCFSISFIALGVLVVIFLVYNKMVQYEEGVLEQLFGETFLDYKKQVPRWIPKLF